MQVYNRIEIENYFDGYYHFSKDLLDYPEAWCYVVWSKRGPGKTYSALRYYYAHKIKFIYIKRTNEDVDFICTDSIKSGIDPSPFSPINRDFNTRVKAKKIDKGLGGFYECNEEGEVVGEPIGYILSLNIVKRIKGFNLDSVDAIIFDEFIPQAGEIVRYSESDQLLDLYLTVSRDRLERGRPALKLILFANSENVATPITNGLELTDIIAEMENKNIFYDTDRDIFLHHITEEDFPTKEVAKQGIYKAMKGTKWFEKSFGGNFANNDFTNVTKQSLKNYRCFISLKHNHKKYFIYYKETSGLYYMTDSPGKALYNYDLNRENDQKLFLLDFGLMLKMAIAEDRMKFKKYSMYDLLINYKKYFKL